MLLESRYIIFPPSYIYLYVGIVSQVSPVPSYLKLSSASLSLALWAGMPQIHNSFIKYLLSFVKHNLFAVDFE